MEVDAIAGETAGWVRGARLALWGTAIALTMNSQAAWAGTTTVLCDRNHPNEVQNEPTVIELNEAQSTVTLHIGGFHLADSNGVTGGDDGHGGIAPFTIGPVRATFDANTISFPGEGPFVRFTLNRLRGTLEESSSGLRWINCLLPSRSSK
jgi:hypothetical protein